MTPLRPLGSRVLIKPDIEAQEVEQTASGILTAKTLEAAVEGEDARESWYQGTVVAIGEQVRCPEFVVGDRVVFSSVSGHQLDLDGERYLVLHDADILGVLEHV